MQQYKHIKKKGEERKDIGSGNLGEKALSTSQPARRLSPERGPSWCPGRKRILGVENL